MTPTEQKAFDVMREAHRKLIRAYVNLLESGRDRITSLGGTCDPVDQMEAGDPALREAKDAITAANAVSVEAQGEAPKWVDVQQRTAIAQAVHAAIRKEVPRLGPWSAFNADEAQRIVDAITHPQAIEPAGYKLVPPEATSNMYSAGAEALTEHAKMLKAMGRSTDMIHTSDEALSRKMYKAMLAAAPETKQ